jgi:uncharacterized cupredoxin-like copper-binding protein
MKHRFLSAISLLALTLCLALLVACGSNAAPSTSAAPVATVTQPTVPAGDTLVQITLQNIKIHSSMTTFKVGVHYFFVIINKDNVEHEFMISPAGMGGHIMSSSMMGVTFALVEHIKPHTIRTLAYTFQYPEPAGSIEFACHYGNHYAMGMLLPVIVVK